MKMWKDKEGNKLTFKEFTSRWKDGIEGITPLQQTKTQLTSHRIMFIGLFSGLVISIIAWKKMWWVGLILIAAILNTGVQYLATKQQKKLYQDIEDKFKEATEDEVEDNSQQKKDEDFPSGNHLDTRSETGEDKLARDMPVDVDNHADTNSSSEQGQQKMSSKDIVQDSPPEYVGSLNHVFTNMYKKTKFLITEKEVKQNE